MADTALTLSEYMFVNNDATGQVAFNADKAVRAVNMRQMTPAELEEMIRTATGRYISPAKSINGSSMTFDFSDTPTYTKTNPINSNESTVSRGKVTRPISTTINQATGKVEASILRGIGSKTLTAISKVAAPVAAAQAACFLGKTIDATVYNANPDFWDSMGFSTVNPETWKNFIYSDPNAPEYINGFLQMITGIDPNTGESQAYMNADTLAYMAYCMQLAGMFSASGQSTIDPQDVIAMDLSTPIVVSKYEITSVSDWSRHAYKCNTPWMVYTYNDRAVAVYLYANAPTTVYISQYNNYYALIVKSDGSSGEIYNRGFYIDNGVVVSDGTYSLSTNYTYNSTRVNYTTFYGNALSNVQFATPTSNVDNINVTNFSGKTAWIMVNGTLIESSTIEGIGTQEGATTPQLDGLSESEILPALQQQYPDAFNNAITWPNVQSDGTVTDLIYVPVPWVNATSPLDNHPVTGEYTQAQPTINPATASPDMLQYLTDFLQDLLPTQQPPTNPTDTGEGSTPVPVAPTGQASSLWKIYHPTQAQVDQFGAWLWSPSFVDQIAKIFNNPMESIIGLHKVYASPIDAGTSTIHVGYLDSGVNSAYIEQQYIDVDCGSIDLYEQFGNVLDYTGTAVKLYLPFIGIVSLGVAEVMRSSINISYGVDVLTGACLARVTISRDGNDAIMYQYAGNCAVQYPVSSGSYMGIVSSIIGVAGSVAATVASGGSVAPLAIGAAGAAFGAHTTVQNSGSFSGNAGAMGGKTPYLIIERVQSALADDFASFEGYPANQNVRIGDCSGYIECATVHILSVNATDDELTEINNLLLSGVIV